MKKIFWYSLPFIVMFIAMVLVAHFGYNLDLPRALGVIAIIFGVGGVIVALAWFCNHMANK